MKSRHSRRTLLPLLVIFAVGAIDAAASRGGTLKLKRPDLPAEGIFAIDPSTKAITQVAYVPSAGVIKYSFLRTTSDTFDFACIPDNEGNLYSFTADFSRAELPSSPAMMRLRKAPGSFLNGPAYCNRQHHLTFGEVRETAIWLRTLDASVLDGLTSTTVADATHAGLIGTAQSDDFQISTDIVCRDLPAGILYNGKDCHDSKTVMDCLASGKGLSSIHYKASEKDAAVQLSFPQSDATITHPFGDMDPDILFTGPSERHLMFERMYLPPEVKNDSGAKAEFRQNGVGHLIYKRWTTDPRGSSEYHLDFSRWMKSATNHIFLIYPHMEVDPHRSDRIRFAAMANFAVPNPKSGVDEGGYLGLITASFDFHSLPQGPNPRIVIDPADVDELVDYGGFTCQVWDRFGMAPADGNVYIYGLHAPKFLSARGKEYVIFSSTKVLYGSLKGDTVNFLNGTKQSAREFHRLVCGR